MKASLDYLEAVKFAKTLAQDKGDFLLSKWNDIGELEYHGNVDFSTKYDKQVEQEIHDQIMQKFPDHGFWGEEDEALHNIDSDFIWYVDPIDGTKYFGHEVPFFTTTIGLEYKGEPVLGVVYNPVSRQMYWAAKGVGAYLNERLIQLKDIDKIENAMLAIDSIGIYSDWETKKLTRLHNECYRVRIFGNGTLSICWSLHGPLSGYVDLWGLLDNGKKQDLVAPLAIAKLAGMHIEHLIIDGKTKTICVHPNIAADIIKILKEE